MFVLGLLDSDLIRSKDTFTYFRSDTPGRGVCCEEVSKFYMEEKKKDYCFLLSLGSRKTIYLYTSSPLRLKHFIRVDVSMIDVK